MPSNAVQTREQFHQSLCEALAAQVSAAERPVLQAFVERLLQPLTLAQLQCQPQAELQQTLLAAWRLLGAAAPSGTGWPAPLQALLASDASEAARLRECFAEDLPAVYLESFAAEELLADLRQLQSLLQQDDGALRMRFYSPPQSQPGQLHGKLYRVGAPLALSDVLPVLENLGLRVLGEFSYRLPGRDGLLCWIHDFAFSHAEPQELVPEQLNQRLCDAALQILDGRVENDAFNRLVLRADLHWRDVVLLRAYGRYLKQIRLGFDLGYIAAALGNHPQIAAQLVALFHCRFDPQAGLDAALRLERQQVLEQALLAALEQVAVLSEDLILRRYLALIQATLRCNFYRRDAAGQLREQLSFKLDPRQLPQMPRPVPRYEIFVYSPRVEGVHLRGGPVARGGLRWSDREEDYRTEVLGLVKAQQVKNAVIVPVGAKGGFVPRQLPLGAAREAIQAEAIACYRIFVSGLLDLTDNLVEGQVQPPPQVLRYDGDDPYLVVAADKGTASFSDIANALAAEYGFWLGDAFASGGSAGYDHKKIGITARGAWISVQRHFRERGIDVQTQPISVLGIGDMSGDVFGNGLLQSPSVRLVAAFNHQHIFIDPDPDPARSFTERLRLFALPRSSWADYDASLISPGGGVFPRSAKRIAISEPMRRRFAIQAEALTPVELIAALLRAPLDLLWNGGIGTYVKASSESHADVGDKANDAVRIDGRELGARVVGEGGNLGMTQLGRVEYALAGGACNTDFIDNAGGVNCSDHEVNLKILCGELLARGQLERAQRDRLLAGLTEAVAQQVLRDNYKQAQALSIARRRARERQGEYQRLIAALEAGGLLDRGLEYLPSDEQLAERAAAGEGLTRPELAVLMAYSKLELKTALLQSPLPDAPYLTAELASAFPAELEPAWRAGLAGHRLRREIIATQLANDLVNHMGITFVQRLRESTGMDAAAIVQAYTLVRELFRLPYWWQQVEALEQSLPAELQLSLMEALMRLGRRATRWFLRNRRRQSLDVPAALQQFAERLPQLGERLGELLQGAPREQWQAQYREYLQAGVPAALAQQLAAAGHLYSLLAVIDAADTCASEPLALAELFFRVGAELGLDTYHQQVTALPVHNHWQALAREAYRDDLEWQQRSLSVSVLRSAEGESAARLEHWLAQHAGLVQRWRAMLAELRTANATDYALYAVANRELLDLAQSAAGEGG